MGLNPGWSGHISAGQDTEISAHIKGAGGQNHFRKRVRALDLKAEKFAGKGELAYMKLCLVGGKGRWKGLCELCA